MKHADSRLKIVYSASRCLWSTINSPATSNCSIFGVLSLLGQLCRHLNPYQTHMSSAQSVKTQWPPTSQICEKRALEKTSSQGWQPWWGEKCSSVQASPDSQGDSAQKAWSKVMNQETDSNCQLHSTGQL